MPSPTQLKAWLLLQFSAARIKYRCRRSHARFTTTLPGQHNNSTRYVASTVIVPKLKSLVPQQCTTAISIAFASSAPLLMPAFTTFRGRPTAQAYKMAPAQRSQLTHTNSLCLSTTFSQRADRRIPPFSSSTLVAFDPLPPVSLFPLLSPPLASLCPHLPFLVVSLPCQLSSHF